MLVIKIILLALLGLLALLLLVLLLALFYPIGYRADADYDKRPYVTVRAWWLLHALSFAYVRDTGGEHMRIRVLGKLMGGKRARKAGNGPAKKAEEREPVAVEITPPEKPAGQPGTSTKKAEKKTPEKKEKGPPWWEKLAAICRNALAVLRYPERQDIQRRAWVMVKRLLRALLPKRLRLTGVIGFESPDQTGMAIGAIYAVLGMAPELGSRVLIQGNFQEPCLALRLRARGCLTVWALLFPLARFALSKPVWKLLKPYIFHK